MKWGTMAMVVALAAVSFSASADDEKKADGKASIEAVGLTIAKAKPGDKFGGSYLIGRPAGVAIILRLVEPNRSIVALDAEASRLTSFVDDKGTDLSAPKKGASGFGSDWLGSFPDIGKDGHSCQFEVRGHLPAKGAAKLSLRAEIVYRCGTGAETIASTTQLTKGAAFPFGPVNVTIDEVKDASWGQSKMTFTLKSDKTFEAVKSVTFLDAEGKEIKHSAMGSGRMGFGKKFTYTRSFGLHRKVEKVTVKVEYYSKIETVRMPLDLTVGVGL